MIKNYKVLKVPAELHGEINSMKTICRCTSIELIEAMVYLVKIDDIKKYLYNKGE